MSSKQQTDISSIIYTGILPNGDLYIGTEVPECGFATESGENQESFCGSASCGETGERPFLNEFCVPIKCQKCSQWVSNPSKHILDNPNDDNIPSYHRDFGQHCESESDNVVICNRCGWPDKINGFRIGNHTDGPESCSNHGYMSEEMYRKNFNEHGFPRSFDETTEQQVGGFANFAKEIYNKPEFEQTCRECGGPIYSDRGGFCKSCTSNWLDRI